MTLSVAIRLARPGFDLDVAFAAPQGVTALFGRSGAGKTTVVQAVAGLLRPDRGRIALGDRVLSEGRTFLPPHRRRIGYVFQDGRLFPHLSVRQNLLYGRWFAGARATAEIGPVVEMLGIGALMHRPTAGLSGGEKQRVALGRALLSGPELLLMDEPLAALDQARKDEILPYLERLRDETRLPILYVTHAASEVARLATTVVVLDRGRVAAAGPVAEVLSDPAAGAVLGLRELGAVIEARILAHDADGLTQLAWSGGRLILPHVAAAPGTQVRVRIHAEDVMIARAPPQDISALNVLPAVVEAVRLGEGPGALVRLAVGQDRILARVTRRSVEALALAPGTPCHAVLKSVAVAKGDIGHGA
ncbi:molybdenum ABC transporter ATP-binding protein [Frigidibacter sp. MR17.24]|uniref:molybdenum ABC transporter ATP-binding protein n=1 Tax=Frigidibacter sp. MR17.24 TaxID=3127345 RepID=UPI0030129FBF